MVNSIKKIAKYNAEQLILLNLIFFLVTALKNMLYKYEYASVWFSQDFFFIIFY